MVSSGPREPVPFQQFSRVPSNYPSILNNEGPSCMSLVMGVWMAVLASPVGLVWGCARARVCFGGVQSTVKVEKPMGSPKVYFYCYH